MYMDSAVLLRLSNGIHALMIKNLPFYIRKLHEILSFIIDRYLETRYFCVSSSAKRNRPLNLPNGYLTSHAIKQLTFDKAVSVIVSSKWIGFEWKWRYPIQRNIVGHAKGCCNNFNDPNHTDLSAAAPYSYVYYGHEPISGSLPG
jgi:hypothetical protein